MHKNNYVIIKITDSSVHTFNTEKTKCCYKAELVKKSYFVNVYKSLLFRNKKIYLIKCPEISVSKYPCGTSGGFDTCVK